MPKINVLDSTVFNRISAGEVVERPASIVKELVENSLDAGATHIKIKVEGGGVKTIRVEDDGCGIEEDDFKYVLKPHATSKIKDVDDLDNIATLGFRGEALASIASVTNIDFSSRPHDKEYGQYMSLFKGFLNGPTAVAMKKGTIFDVKNLFYNTPARLKFLKRSKFEENEITNIVERFILANPNVEFEYTVENKVMYNIVSNSLKDRIEAIYGSAMQRSLLEINCEKNGMKLYGYVTDQNYTKPNRTYQTLIVNGRYVISNYISSVVYSAFDGHLMKGEFPFFVLNLTIDTSEVDVNVHPSKREIKFANEAEVATFISLAVRRALNKPRISRVIEDDIFATNECDASGADCCNEKAQDEKVQTNPAYTMSKEEISDMQSILNQKYKEAVCENLDNAKIDFELPKYKEPPQKKHELKAPANSYLSEIRLKQPYPYDGKCFSTFEEINLKRPQPKQIEVDFGVQFSYIGSIFDSYIIVEQNDKMYLIDQHAAHERVNYDKLIEGYEVVTQPLAFPYYYDACRIDICLIEDKLSDLNSLGFEVRIVGPEQLRIDAIPSILQNIDLDQFFDSMFEDVKFFSDRAGKIIRNKIATMACRASIKAGDKLCDSEIKWLLKKLGEENVLLLCPHGRPVVVTITKSQVEKWFKRTTK